MSGSGEVPVLQTDREQTFCVAPRVTDKGRWKAENERSLGMGVAQLANASKDRELRVNIAIGRPGGPDLG
jgi:hypothetical protein